MPRDTPTASAARALEETLRTRIAGEVDFGTGARALYATDASNYRQVPIGVVLPKNTEDVLEVVRTCHEHGIPILPRGAGTSLAGQCCNVAVVMDMSRHLRDILSIDPDQTLARIRLLPDGEAWLLVEFGAETAQVAETAARLLLARLSRRWSGPSGTVFTDPHEIEMVWLIRESGLGATAFVPGESATWEGWEDAAVPPPRLSAYLRDFRRLLKRFAYRGSLYGHFGQGCTRVRTSTWKRRRALRRIALSSTRLPIWSWRTAARSPVSTATGSHARSSCPRCSATPWWARSASSSTSGIPTV